MRLDKHPSISRRPILDGPRSRKSTVKHLPSRRSYERLSFMDCVVPPPDKRSLHRKAYEDVIKGKVTLLSHFVGCLYGGILRSGKTTLRKRMTGQMESLRKQREIARRKGEEPSTGVADSSVQILRRLRPMCSQFSVLSQGWSLLKDPKDEAKLLSRIISQLASRSNPVVENSTTSEEEGFVEENRQETQAKNIWPSFYTIEAMKEEDLEEVFSLLTKDIEEKDWEDVKYLLEDIIVMINTDAGGQAEFHELQAPLVSSASLFLLFWCLTDDLDQVFDVYCTNKEGVSTKKKKSTLTVEEVLYQIIAGITGSSGCFLETPPAKGGGPKSCLWAHIVTK